MSFHQHLLTAGGGQGRLSFYDMRTSSFIQLPGCDGVQLFYKVGKGWLDRTTEIYLTHFAGTTVENAIYAHAWSPSGTRLFSAGGPLMVS